MMKIKELIIEEINENPNSIYTPLIMKYNIEKKRGHKISYFVFKEELDNILKNETS